MLVQRIGQKIEIKRTYYCCSCDIQLGLGMEPKSVIGPVNHLNEFPDHFVIEVEGELHIWRSA